MLNMYFMCDYTNCAPPCLVSMFGSIKRTGGQPDVRWFGTKSCFPTLPSRQLESFTILAGGCSQHEKASCVAIALDIGRSLDIDTWISKKNKKIHFEKGVDFDILRWNFFRNFLHLKVWWIAGAPQFFGSQFYTYDLWRLGWEIDGWCGLEVFDHLCIVIIFVILAPLRRKGMEDMKMMFWMGFPLFRCSNLKPLNIRDSSLEVWALTWTPIVQGCPGTLMALIMESGMEKHQGQQHLQAMVFLTKVRSPFIFRFFSCWVQRTLLGWPLLSFEFVSSVLSYFWEGVFP